MINNTIHIIEIKFIDFSCKLFTTRWISVLWVHDCMIYIFMTQWVIIPYIIIVGIDENIM